MRRREISGEVKSVPRAPPDHRRAYGPASRLCWQGLHALAVDRRSRQRKPTAHSRPARALRDFRCRARRRGSLEKVAKKLQASRNRAFDPPFTTLNVGLIHGGTAKNIIPGECRITVEWRPIPGYPVDAAVLLIREALAGMRGIDATFHVLRLDPPFRSFGDQSAGRNGRRPFTKNSSDYCIVRHRSSTPAGSLAGEVIVFGAGDMTVAHTSQECVPVKDLRACAGYLATIIETLCK